MSEINDDKKKQKAGLGAIRPDEYVESKFKQLAEDNNISQTKMFERIFWNYLSSSRKDKKEEAISFESEIELLDTEFKNVLDIFKNIVDKSQNTVLTLKSNIEQTEKNCDIKTDTLNRRIEELENRNNELEHSNSIFGEVKENLENKINDLNSVIVKKDKEIQEIKDIVKSGIKDMENLTKEIDVLVREKATLNYQYKGLLEDIDRKDTKIKGLEINNIGLKDTLDNLNKIKQIEIESLESKYKNTVGELENRLDNVKGKHIADIKEMEVRLRKELEAEMKLAIVESKLELSETKNKYNELLVKYNEIVLENSKRIKKISIVNK